MTPTNMKNPGMNSTALCYVANAGVLIAANACGLILTGANLFTIAIVVSSSRLRTATNIPVVSFLLASALQSFVAVPTYVFKHAEGHQEHRPAWICDAFRISYFICGHTMVMSMLYISCDRLLAIKSPYAYQDLVTKKRATILLSVMWILVLAVDAVPLFPLGHRRDADGCYYIPQQSWGLCVILFFNVLPFLLIFINYFLLWRVAARFEVKDYLSKRALTLTNASNSESSRSARIPPSSFWRRTQGFFKVDRKCPDSGGEMINLENDRNRERTTPLCGADELFSWANAQTLTNRLSEAEGVLDIDKLTLHDECSITSLKEATSTACNSGGSSSLLDKVELKQVAQNAEHSPQHRDLHAIAEHDCGVLCQQSTELHQNRKSRDRSGIDFMFAFNMRCTKTSLMLLAVYLFCWGPMAVFFAIDQFCDRCLSSSADKHKANTRFAVKILCLSSSFLAPLVYCWRTRDFRHEVWRRFCGRCSKVSDATYSFHVIAASKNSDPHA